MTSFQSRVDFSSQPAPTQHEEHSDGWIAKLSLSLSLSLAAMLTMTASARDLILPPGPPNPPEEWYKEREESSPVIPPGSTPFPYTDCNHNGVADRSESFPDCDSNGIGTPPTVDAVSKALLDGDESAVAVARTLRPLELTAVAD